MQRLIIVSGLCEPPSDSMAVRAVTMEAKDVSMDVLVEVEAEVKDDFYRYFKPRGLFDYVDALVEPKENEVGVRIDNQHLQPMTIVVPAIRFENYLNILGQLRWLKRF